MTVVDVSPSSNLDFGRIGVFAWSIRYYSPYDEWALLYFIARVTSWLTDSNTSCFTRCFASRGIFLSQDVFLLSSVRCRSTPVTSIRGGLAGFHWGTSAFAWERPPLLPSAVLMRRRSVFESPWLDLQVLGIIFTCVPIISVVGRSFFLVATVIVGRLFEEKLFGVVIKLGFSPASSIVLECRLLQDVGLQFQGLDVLRFFG